MTNANQASFNGLKNLPRDLLGRVSNNRLPKWLVGRVSGNPLPTAKSGEIRCQLNVRRPRLSRIWEDTPPSRARSQPQLAKPRRTLAGLPYAPDAEIRRVLAGDGFLRISRAAAPLLLFWGTPPSGERAQNTTHCEEDAWGGRACARRPPYIYTRR